MDEKRLKIERQFYDVLRQGFETLNKSLKDFASKLGTEVKIESIDTSGPTAEHHKYQLLAKGFTGIANIFKQIDGIKGLKGDTGDKYTLTEQDKSDISKLINVSIDNASIAERAVQLIDKEYLITSTIDRVIASLPKQDKQITKQEIVDLIAQSIPQQEKQEDIAPIVYGRIIESIKKLIPKEEPIEDLADRLAGLNKQWLPIDAIIGDFNTKIIRQWGGGGSRRFEDMVDIDFTSVTKVGDKYVFGGSSSSTPQGAILSYTGYKLTQKEKDDGTIYTYSYTGNKLTSKTNGTYTWNYTYTGNQLTLITVT